MSYTKLTDYAVKDGLPAGNSSKIIRGTEIDADFSAIEADLLLKATEAYADAAAAAAAAAKADIASPTFTGVPAAPTASLGTNTTQLATTAFVQNTAFTLSTFIDSTPIVKGSADATKQVRMEVDGLTTATTRVLTVPDADMTLVGVDTTQTLTNKDLTSGTNTFPTSLATLTGVQTLTNKTLTGYTETVYTLSGTVIDPANGTVQTKTLSANTTFTESIGDGQSVILGITAGAYSVTWPSVTWAKVGGSGVAPTLTSTGVNWVVLWQVGGTLRGSFLGTA